MKHLQPLWDMFQRLLESPSRPKESAEKHARTIATLSQSYGLIIVESDLKGNARRWRLDELAMLTETLQLLGPAFYEPFVQNPVHVWIDRNPGSGHFGNNWLRIGDPGHDLSVLYRIFLHEGTHASNEYRGWPYEKTYCTCPGLDWRREGERWVHPRQQGREPEPGEWETLPVSARDVSTAPGEDLAETVRYFVHSVRDERAWLWPLDLSQPPMYLWDTSPTRYIYVRDHFLALPGEHPWHKRLDTETERRVAANLACASND